ncbi:PAS domain S-box protein [Natronolimnobius sp. AArcel1]|uniref:PAS domain-containing sensor histidine kinase n=1 Tax=Natronolimnobius sp. AArcel1 TaxID=1679093 RepID=UPI0013EAA27F|nr:PAS domain S-box protein [Natronolimnobius sp. AArcel1]NGM71098.1 PAS domain S-box protein [Natronolimnobius sp. AArcel1]
MADDEWAQTLLEYAQDKIAVIDETGRYVYVNEASTDILGIEPTALIGENVFEYIHDDDVVTARQRFERIVETEPEQPNPIRYRHRTATGEWTWLESRVSSVDMTPQFDSDLETDASGGHYVVSSRDISAQVVAEQDRQQARERLEAITQTTGDVLWLFTGDWEELLFVNPAYEEIYGQSIAALEADPSSFIDAIHPDDRAAVRETMRRLSTGKPAGVEYRVNPDHDYDRWVWVRAEPILSDGEVTRIVGFTRDITDRRRRKRQLVVMDTLLRHNLRNDMCVILGMAEQLTRATTDDADASVPTLEPETVSQYTDVICEHGEQLLESASKQRQIIDLLAHAPVRSAADTVSIVSDAIEQTRASYTASIETELPESALAITITELKAAIRELLENAVEHAPSDDPEVTVAIEPTGDDTVAITVQDDCPPIPELEFRVLTGEWEMTDVYHTSGLGLWLVYWVVDLSNGWVDFSRSEDANRGNEITLYLPRAPTAANR